MELGLNGKVAAITGGSEGIGLATALRLAAEDAVVGICARCQEPLEKAGAEKRVRLWYFDIPLYFLQRSALWLSNDHRPRSKTTAVAAMPFPSPAQPNFSVVAALILILLSGT